MARDKKYEKMVSEINELREQLKNKPGDIKLKDSITQKEEALFAYVTRSTSTLDEFFRYEREIHPDELDNGDEPF